MQLICRSYGVFLILRKMDWPKQERQEKPIAAKKKKKKRLSANGLMLTKIMFDYDFYKQRPCHYSGPPLPALRWIRLRTA